ncbi:MAG: sirohydrochlorin cobaltochelatase [archaeon]|nr:sirohydrochlorin cobaltochelatase [archaeon]
MAKKAILVISFGTSYNDNREKTIVPTEKVIAAAFPDRELRRAWTSKMIIAKLKKRDNEYIDYIDEAMDKLVKDGFDDVIVQPTHVMNGEEYDFVKEFVLPYKEKIPALKLGKPLLTTDEDYDNVVEAIAKDIKPLCTGDAMILMGHGTEHFANATYSELQLKLIAAGEKNIFITTVEGFPTFDSTLALMEGKGIKKVTLMPFMIVAGDHANNDMAGDEEDSLKSVVSAAGYEVDCVIQGLGSLPAFQQMFAEHAKNAE